MSRSPSSHRIYAYDFFQGVLVVGLIFLLLFIKFLEPSFELFYRWASLGFLFFSGVILGEILWKKKTPLFFLRRGLQVLGMFLLLNISLWVLHFSDLSFSSWENFSLLVLQGDFSLIASLLLPLGALFLLSPFLSVIPTFLGLLWSILAFFILDILWIEKNIYFLNAIFLLVGCIGFYTGRFFSLEKMRGFIAKKSPFLPALLLYLAISILLIGGVFKIYFETEFSLFWSFHFFLFLLLFFSLPSSFFFTQKPKPLSRRFFETLGVEILFVYIFVSIVIEVLFFLFQDLQSSSSLELSILAVHISILSFAVVSIIKKVSQKSKYFKKVFRFLF